MLPGKSADKYYSKSKEAYLRALLYAEMKG